MQELLNLNPFRCFCEDSLFFTSRLKFEKFMIVEKEEYSNIFFKKKVSRNIILTPKTPHLILELVISKTSGWN